MSAQPREPQPTEPGPTEPGPTEPGPTEPGPTAPGQTNPPSVYAVDSVAGWRPRWWLVAREWLAILSAIRLLAPRVPQPTAGRPVLLVPGFMSGDWSLGKATRVLRLLGYRTFTVGIRVNAGCTRVMVERVERRAVELAEQLGAPVALVGHSRGGTIARVVGQRRPEVVSHVITLGSPLTHQFAGSQRVLDVAERLSTWGSRHGRDLLDDSCLRGSCAVEIGTALASPMPDRVAFTSIYSRSDGIVQWRSCLAPGADAVRVRGSHNGLILNGTALAATVRALGDPHAA